MSEVLCKLVVALSLDSDNFARNLRTINKQTKEAKSTFNLEVAFLREISKARFANEEITHGICGNVGISAQAERHKLHQAKQVLRFPSA